MKKSPSWRDEDEAAAEELQHLQTGDGNGQSSEFVHVKDGTKPSDSGSEFEADYESYATSGDAREGGEVPYSEIVKRYPVVRQSYVEGHQGEVGAAVAACHPWKQKAEACFKSATKANEGQCMRLQITFMACMGERVVPQHFDRLRRCLGANQNDISRCEAPLLDMMNQLEEKAKVENRQREMAAARKANEDDSDVQQDGDASDADLPGLEAWERQKLIECGLTAARQSEIDCMIPKVCVREHDLLRRCIGRQGASSRTPSKGNRPFILNDSCVEMAKQALRCWGAFNRRREQAIPSPTTSKD